MWAFRVFEYFGTVSPTVQALVQELGRSWVLVQELSSDPCVVTLQ